MPTTLRSKYRAESEVITTSLKLWELYTLSVSHDHVFNSYTKGKGEYLTDKYKEEEYSGKDSEKGIKQKPSTNGRCLTLCFPQRKACRDSIYATKSTGE